MQATCVFNEPKKNYNLTCNLHLFQITLKDRKTSSNPQPPFPIPSLRLPTS